MNDEKYLRPVENIYKTGKGHCFGEDQNINGNLILTNLRIYLEIDEEHKYNEIMLKDVKKVSIGGINVLRFDLKNGERYNFLVNNVIGWYSAVKKVIKKSNKSQ